MFDLRDYKDLIRAEVKKLDEKDANWKWSVKSIGKKQVKIRWGYLDYLEEENNCFIMEADCDSCCGDWIWAIRPDGDRIECYMVAENPNPRIGAEQTITSGIKDAIWEIGYHAGSRY